MKKNQLFISYAHKDDNQVNLIASSLSKLGWKIWKDQRLTIGEEFSKEIEKALDSCTLVLVIWSRSSIQSDWVKKEARLAIKQDKYFPIRIEHVSLPNEFEKYHAEGLFRWNGEIDEEQFSAIYLQIFDKIPIDNNETEKLIEKARLRRDFFFNSASIWNKLADGINDRTDVKWPFWMVRNIVADTKESLNDLIWSVGGSPPYGGVDYEEAEAVYKLINGFMGKGKAEEKLYAQLERFIINKPVELKALEAFRIYDKVASNSQSYVFSDLRIGNEEAVHVVDEPLNSYFNLLKAQLFYNEGKLIEAYDTILKTVNPLLRFAHTDPVYTNRLSQSLTNTAIFATLNGDLVQARYCAKELDKIGLSHMLANFKDLLLNEPDFSNNISVDEIENTAWTLMQDKKLPHYAIEWYKEAEKRYRVQGNYVKLSGLLGDMAVCYRRLGNMQMCIKFNRFAIEEGQKSKDTLSIYRWCQNLAGILMRSKDYEGAFPYLRLSLYASARLVEPNDIKLSASALFDYHAYKLCSSDDIKEMYKTALEMIAPIENIKKMEESKLILEDFINDKPHFASL